MPVFGPPQIMFVKGAGTELWDADGTRYLDFLGGLAVIALGHANPVVAEAIAQIERLERDPIPYTEQRPRRDLAGLAYAASLVGLVILVAAKLGEADLSRSGLSAARSPATASDPARRAA